MYLEYYGLNEPPFSITPDPRFVFLSERHRDALAHLLFGVGQGGGGGFVQLTGEVGTGKTTLSRLLLEQLPQLQASTPARVALVLNPRLSPVELLETICEELRLDLDPDTGHSARGSLKALVDLLNRYLLDAYAQGLRVVLIIDEAQNLSRDALEQVRLLTNLETATQKLLQVILIGQPELRTMLARQDMRQLAQRITARYHLTPLDAAETQAYLRHRFAVAGGGRLPFTAAAIRRVHAHSRGVPRLINVIGERALLAGYAHELPVIDEHWVQRAADEALAPTRQPMAYRRPAAAAAGLALLIAAAWWWPRAGSGIAAPPATAARAAPALTTAAATHAPSPRGAPAPSTSVLLDADALAARITAATASPAAGWQYLRAQWGLAAGPDVATIADCQATLAPGMHCLRSRGNLDKLARQGRPALLRLRAPGGEAWAVLLGADAVNARVWLGGGVLDTSRVALERAWSGEAITLWRVPAGVMVAGGAGLDGAGLDGAGLDGAGLDVGLTWIHARLAPRYLAVGSASAPGPALRAAVRQFQAERGLLSDGVVGPETLLALASDEPGPRLQRVLE